SVSRLVAVAVAVGVMIVANWWGLVPLGAFVVLVVIHDRTVDVRKRAEGAAAFYERGLERVVGSWRGKGIAGSELDEVHHPYASDLDLFGKGSLFELLCTAATAAGRALLARWLKEPLLELQEIETRQRSVEELRERVELREELAVLAADVTAGIEQAQLDRWGEAEAVPFALWEQLAAFLLPAATLIVLGIWKPLWLPVPLILEMLFSRRLRDRVQTTIAAVERAEPAFALLARLLERLERERFQTPRLVALRARLDRQGVPASRQIARLRRIVGMLDARRNQLFAGIAAMLLWTAHCAFAVERWRRESGREIASWIAAVAELEALLSLASFAFEHPEFTMPELIADGPCFVAEGLGHPLIPAGQRVTNDLRLDGEMRLLVISGSNMSGKSTLLRSTGVAAVLAMAGAPVCARRLRMAPMRVGASIQLHDSLQEGASRFYAEIVRIKQILDMATTTAPGQPHLLFLLDEILHGTNSHDRRIGAAGIVKALVARGAVGLVSTHDLALAKIAEELAPHAANVHFEDHLEEGRMVFDYTMRPGVVEKSNALALMRALGIDV
ncbi:MAG: mismatch repair ATPase (MutS family), partial [Acidobacteria bacterium]|nr:mismatch repair ATPase (MutS family) [Acidobacteriota bacterium]